MKTSEWELFRKAINNTRQEAVVTANLIEKGILYRCPECNEVNGTGSQICQFCGKERA